METPIQENLQKSEEHVYKSTTNENTTESYFSKSEEVLNSLETHLSESSKEIIATSNVQYGMISFSFTVESDSLHIQAKSPEGTFDGTFTSKNIASATSQLLLDSNSLRNFLCSCFQLKPWGRISAEMILECHFISSFRDVSFRLFLDRIVENQKAEDVLNASVEIQRSDSTLVSSDTPSITPCTVSIIHSENSDKITLKLDYHGELIKDNARVFFGFFSASKKSELLAQAIYIHPDEINLEPTENPSFFKIQRPKNFSEMFTSKNDRALILVTLKTSNGSRVMTWVPYFSDLPSENTIFRSKTFLMERRKDFIDVSKPKRENSGKGSFLKSSLEAPTVSHIIPNFLRVSHTSLNSPNRITLYGHSLRGAPSLWMSIKGTDRRVSITNPTIRKKSEINFQTPMIDSFFPGLSGEFFPVGNSTIETELVTEIDGVSIDSNQRFFYQFRSEIDLSRMVAQDCSPNRGFISQFAPAKPKISRSELSKMSTLSVAYSANLRNSENVISHDESLANIRSMDLPDTWTTNVKPAIVGIQNIDLVYQGLPSLNHLLQTSVHLAVITGNIEVLRFLIDSTVMSCYISVQDIFGCTPLHYAVQQDSPELVHILLRSGAILYIRDCEGKTPYDVAKELGCERVLNLVQEGEKKTLAFEKQRRATIALSAKPEEKNTAVVPSHPPISRMRSLTLGWKSFVDKILEKPEESPVNNPTEKVKEPEIEYQAAILHAGREIWKADEIKFKVGKSKIVLSEKNLRTEDYRVEFEEKLFKFRKFNKKDVDVKLLPRFYHPNLVKLYAIINKPFQGVISEFYPTLRSLKMVVSEEDRYKFMKQIVTGLKYIHNIPSHHGDLHSGNIIVRESGVLIDFSSTFGKKEGSQKSDILYFGILAYEILSKKLITEDLAEFPKIVDKIQKGKMDMYIPGEKNALTDVIQKCFDTEPRKRPAFNEILFAIEKVH